MVNETNAAERPWRVVVFARAPIAGVTKTRLIPALGAEGAASLHARMLERMLATAAAAAPDAVELWCADEPIGVELRALADRYGASVRVQAEGDLGARMRDAACRVLAEGAWPVLVGSDIAVMDAAYLRAARAALGEGAEAVVGPAEDGGYVLIALARDIPEIFRDVPWSTERVLDLTRERLVRSGAQWRELATLWDVDRPEDLERLRREGLGHLIAGEGHPLVAPLQEDG